MEKIKINQLMLDIADSEEKRSFGLMSRKKINPNSGMIFLWKDSKIRSFWMKNTYFNLDLFFLNSEGIIVEIYKNAKALDETYISSKNKVKYVIELKSGEHDFNVGELWEEIVKHIPESPPYYDKDDLTDRPLRFFISEIIREKIFELCQKEIPYSCTYSYYSIFFFVFLN